MGLWMPNPRPLASKVGILMDGVGKPQGVVGWWYVGGVGWFGVADGGRWIDELTAAFEEGGTPLP